MPPEQLESVALTEVGTRTNFRAVSRSERRSWIGRAIWRSASRVEKLGSGKRRRLRARRRRRPARVRGHLQVRNWRECETSVANAQSGVAKEERL